jgi:hypothetical protein
VAAVAEVKAAAAVVRAVAAVVRAVAAVVRAVAAVVRAVAAVVVDKEMVVDGQVQQGTHLVEDVQITKSIK